MSTVNAEIDHALRPYLWMTTSIEKFGKVASYLNDEEEQALHRLLDNQLQMVSAVLSSPEAKKINVDHQHINHAINELENRFNNPDEFETTLANNAINREILACSLKYQLHCDFVLDLVSQQYTPLTEQQAQAYYFQHLKQFKQPERRQASHILITINEAFIENTRAAAKARLVQIHKKLSPANFAHYAERHSECPTALNEGKLGLVPKGQLHKELDETLFKMKPKKISDIIESEAGFHILLCHAIVPAHTISFAEAKEKIIEQHDQRAKKRAQRAWITALFNQ